MPNKACRQADGRFVTRGTRLLPWNLKLRPARRDVQEEAGGKKRYVVPTRIVRAIAWLSAAAVLLLSLFPPRYRMVTGAPRDLEHFAAFALVGMMLSLAYPEKRLKVVAFGIVAVAAIEFMQLFVPGRHAYLCDFLLNVSSFCLGLASMRMFVRTPVRDKSEIKQPSALA